jgi:hypothetical protein
MVGSRMVVGFLAVKLLATGEGGGPMVEAALSADINGRY